MLALFKKRKVEEKDQLHGVKTKQRNLRQAEKLREETHEEAQIDEPAPIVQELQRVRESVVDEDSLKKSIADKLKNYQPVEREANYTGPKYYRS